MKCPDAILFDVYDTLLRNDLDGWRCAFQGISDEQGLGLSGEDLYTRWKKHEVGFRALRVDMDRLDRTPPFKSYESAWRECFEKVFAAAGLAGDAGLAARRAVEHMARREPFPEAATALSKLSGRTRLGVFSNADEDFLRPVLSTCGLAAKFEAVASSESAQVYKPHPAAFEHILKLMDVPADRAWYVGDHLYDDVRGASGAGLAVVWVNRNGAEAPADGPRPSRTIASLDELVEMYDRVA